MAERREDRVSRTDRPGGGPLTPAQGDALPSLAEILAIAPLAESLPEIVVGGARLHDPVRWVHVSDSAGVARLLNGGELLLSTGSGWPEDPAELTAFVDALDEAGLSGLVIELGSHYRYVPAVVVEECAARGLPLIALHREVKFVSVTEAVHERIIAGQMGALRAREELHRLFTGLSLRGAPADYVVERLAQTLRSPVVLENLAHEVVAAEALGDDGLFSGWEVRSRRVHRDAGAEDDGWLVVPVEARGIRWGALVAPPGPSHPAGRRTVLEQGAIALALSRLADGETDEWARLSGQHLVDALLEGRFAGGPGLAARLEAAGLPIAGRRLHGLSIGVARHERTAGLPEAATALAAGVRELGGRAVAGVAGGTLVALLSMPRSSRFDAPEILRLAAPAAAVLGLAADRLSIALGVEAAGLDGLLRSVEQSRGLVGQPGIRRAEDRPLVRFVSALREDHRLQEHSERMLAPLIEHDLERGGDLLAVLGAMLAHPGNRTAAAAASHLSRSVFYQRLALISELLGADLDDGETLAALHVALLARGRR